MVDAPLHNVWFAIVLTTGVGFTVIVKFLKEPVQPLADGVTVIVAVMGALALLVATKDAMLPVPLAARPMDAVLFVHV